MRGINIENPVIFNDGNNSVIEYNFMHNGIHKKIRNEYEGEWQLYEGAEGIVSLLLSIAVQERIPIIYDGGIDRKFRENLSTWEKNFRYLKNNFTYKMGLQSPLLDNVASEGRKRVLAFTLGVDSFYALYSEMDKIDAILFVIGFDMQQNQKLLLERTLSNLREIASIYNKQLIICKSNIREVYPDGVYWERYMHAPAIISVFYGLSNHFNEGMIASSNQVDDIWGSHPILDEWYSSDIMKIITDDQIIRIKKLDKIVKFDDKCLDYLRVCWKNPGQIYNCSRCEKCLRTMYSLHLLGYWDRQTTFNKHVDPTKYLETVDRNDPRNKVRINDIMTYLKENEEIV